MSYCSLKIAACAYRYLHIRHNLNQRPIRHNLNQRPIRHNLNQRTIRHNLLQRAIRNNLIQRAIRHNLIQRATRGRLDHHMGVTQLSHIMTVLSHNKKTEICLDIFVSGAVTCRISSNSSKLLILKKEYCLSAILFGWLH